MSIEHTSSAGAPAAPRVDRASSSRTHPHHGGKPAAGAAAPGAAFDQLLSLLGAALGEGGTGPSGDGPATTPSMLTGDAAAQAAGPAAAAATAEGASATPPAGLAPDGAQAAVLAQCLPPLLRPADGARTSAVGADAGGTLPLQGAAGATIVAAGGRPGEGHRAVARGDASVLAGAAQAPGTGKDDAGTTLTMGAKPSPGADGGATPLPAPKPAAGHHPDALQSGNQAVRERAPVAEAVAQAASQPLAAESLPLAGARPAREHDRREGDGTLVAGLQGRDGVGRASDNGVTTYALTEPDPAAATTEVAEQLSYWISAGVQNAELQVDAFGGGTVEVSVTVQGNEAQVEFRSDQPEARRLLQDAMPQLRAMLQDEGMVLSGGFVGTSAQGGESPGQRRPERPATRATLPVPGTVEAGGVSAATRSSGAGSRLDVFV